MRGCCVILVAGSLTALSSLLLAALGATTMLLSAGVPWKQGIRLTAYA